MSTSAAELAGAYRADVIPAHILSRPTLRQYATAEETFRRTYVTTVADGLRAAGVTPAIFEGVMRKVADDIRSFAIGYGTAEFDLWATAPTNGTLLVWLSLAVKHPTLTMEDAIKLIDAGDVNAIYDATLQLWGYLGRNEPAPKKAVSQGSENPSPGKASIENSAPPPPMAAA